MSNTSGQKDYTSISYDAVEDIIEEWNSVNREFDNTRLKANEDEMFKVLEAAGISGGFPSRYDTAMEKIVNEISAEINAAKTAINSIREADKRMEEGIPEAPVEEGEEGIPEAPTEEGEEGEDGGAPDTRKNDGSGYEAPSRVDNYKYQMEYYNNLSLEDLNLLVAFLNKASLELNMPIDELLANEEQGSRIIKVLLQMPNISETYKTLLTEGKEEVSLVALRNFVKGDYKSSIGFDDDSTILTFKTYLANIGNNNNPEVVDINQNAYNVSNYLIKGLQPISSALKDINKDNVQERLLEIYNGNYGEKVAINEFTRSIVGTNVNVLASINKIKNDDLLADQANQELLLKSIEKLQRASVYSSLLSNCKDPAKVIESLLK